MSDSDHVKSLIKEADIYRKQGLFKQAVDRYQELSDFVRNHEKFSKDMKFMAALEDKIRRVGEQMAEVEAATDRPALSEKLQTLISKLFSFSGNQETSAVEGAVALAKFGQYEPAVAEFQRLIRAGILPRLAATNLLSCHLTLGSPEAAISQFRQWSSLKELPRGDLEYLRDYLRTALEKRGVQAELPPLDQATPAQEVGEEKEDEEVIGISSVHITLPAGPRKGQAMEFEVTFQSGNAVSILISGGEREVADAFKAGLRLKEIQCYSSMGVFNSSATVTGKSVIASGPKRGHFTLDLTIDNE